jgi:phosphomannomutase
VQSGEINFHVTDKEQIIAAIAKAYADGEASELDGLTVEYPDWWFNVRASNTEDLLRLNVEAKTKTLMEEKLSALTGLIQP